MNKKLIAVAVAGVLAAPAVMADNSVTIYGVADVGLEQVAAHAVGVGAAVEHVGRVAGLEEAAARRVVGLDDAREGQVPGEAGVGVEAVDRVLLGGAPRHGVEVVDLVEQPAFHDLGHQRLGEGDDGLDAVEQARVQLRDEVLLDGAAGAAEAAGAEDTRRLRAEALRPHRRQGRQRAEAIADV